jgi:hypothetical protein
LALQTSGAGVSVMTGVCTTRLGVPTSSTVQVLVKTSSSVKVLVKTSYPSGVAAGASPVVHMAVLYTVVHISPALQQ